MIAGTSLIQRVYERSVHSRRASTVFVATDDDRIAEHVRSFGGRVVRPEGDFLSGTDRIAASLDLLDQQFDVSARRQAGDAERFRKRVDHRERASPDRAGAA